MQEKLENLLTSPSQIQYFETQRVEVLHLNSVELSHGFPTNSCAMTTLGSIAMTISANKIEAYILCKSSTASSIQLKNTAKS